MLRRIVVAASVIAAVPPPAARAQDLAAVCEKVRRPPVGAWSQFRIVGGRNDGAMIRMAIVGTERRGGDELLWLEVAMRGFPMSSAERGRLEPRPMISKMLVRGFGPDAGAPRASVVKIGGSPAMEMPAGRARATGSGAPNLERCRAGKVVGWESVTVPAGTFRALHVIGTAGRNDIWLDPDLPFAMVKESGNEEAQRQMVLVGHGMGARSQITERPRPYDPRLFMEMMTGGAARPRR